MEQEAELEQELMQLLCWISYYFITDCKMLLLNTARFLAPYACSVLVPFIRAAPTILWLRVSSWCLRCYVA
jgi:hypothetical protein